MRLIVIAAAITAALLLLLLSYNEDRPCNAEGDVQYIGDRKYQCEDVGRSGLRWKWKL